MHIVNVTLTFQCLSHRSVSNSKRPRFLPYVYILHVPSPQGYREDPRSCGKVCVPDSVRLSLG